MQSIASIIIISAKTTQCYLSRLVLEMSITKQTARLLVYLSTRQLIVNYQVQTPYVQPRQ